MRPIWNGMISFGMVNIPIGVYSATRSERISFHFLHKKDSGRIHNKRVCDVCGEEVDYEDLVRGYEYEKDKYVALEEEDFEKIEAENSKTITITDFVGQEEIDPMYFDTPYYLVPGKNADHAYVMLREALKRTEKIGIGKVVFREREHLAAVKAQGRALMLDTMHFADEITPAEDLNLPAAKAALKDKEIKLAEQLVEMMTGEFKPEKYKDTYREALEKLIESKLKGKRVRVKTTKKKATTNVVDIMSVLRKSLQNSEPKRKTKPVAKGRKRKVASKAKAA
jgi:DNA end-binding protein Ku